MHELSEVTPTATPGADSLPATPALPHTTQRDRQRAALRDLLTLATESAAMEAEIEARFKAAFEKGTKDFDTTQWSIEQRLKGLEDAQRQKYEERVARAHEAQASETRSVRNEDANKRRQVQSDHEPVEQDIRTKYEQAVWLGDSVFEASQGQMAVETKKAKEEHAGYLQGLNELSSRAFGLMVLYGQRPGAVDPLPGEPVTGDASAAFIERRDNALNLVEQLHALKSPRAFVGAWPYMIIVLVLVLAAAAAQLVMGTIEPQWKALGIAIGAAVIVLFAVGTMVRNIARKHSQQLYGQYRHADASARLAADAWLEQSNAVLAKKLADAAARRKAEVDAAKQRFGPLHNRARQKRDTALLAVHDELAKNVAAIEAKHQQVLSDAAASLERHLTDLAQRKERELQSAAIRHESYVRDTQRKYDDGTAALKQRFEDGIASIQAPIQDRSGQSTDAFRPWDDPFWKTFKPTKAFAEMVRFGDMRVDLQKIADAVPRQGASKLQLPPPFDMPASLGFPRQASLLIQSDRTLRDQAIRTLQMVMTRLLTSLPPGRVRFTIIDPVSLGQNFAGFMHLADHDDALVGGRIWTEQEHIETRLTDLTEHMETVIQKYLRNEFETIDDYNAQAGELAEPYRFLVIADFPVGFEGDTFRRLASIATSGARCGVYTLISRDTRIPLPQGVHVDDLREHSVNLVQDGDHFLWKDDVFQQFPLALDPPPTEELLTDILDVVGRGAKDSRRVEVPFDSIAPKPAEFWSRSTTSELRVPIGRMGASRLQDLKLGRGVAQHCLIAGKTGSGKSTLLHALVTNLAMWYSPDEVEFYLIDFKKGVEFKTYATHNLPHARAIAVESDREFGLSVLQRLDAELTRRGDLFRKAGVQDLNSYRQASPADVMPRTLLIIDEFQEFFSEDDKLAQEAGLLMDRLVRQGRAFGVHLLLGSQTIGGTSGLARSTIGQMAVRVALQTSEADSQLILGDGNSAARLLSRPGEAIYNDAGGLVESNSPFQIAWLSDEKRDRYLDMVNERQAKAKQNFPFPVVFEGNAPADITKNERLLHLIESPAWISPGTAPLMWMGDPVAIKEPSNIAFRRQSGSNVLVIGQSEDSAMALISSALLSLSAQHAPGAANFYVLDGSPADSPLASVLPGLVAILPHGVKLVEWRAVPELMTELAEEIARRQTGDDPNPPGIYVLIYGLQRYRVLRKVEDDFSFSSGSDEEKKPQPGKQFADLLREGPSLGMHVIAWTDTPTSIDRTLDRNSMREFDNRVLFQMSAADSSNLIDSPAANKLGFYRALAYSEEQGVMEKFRPYALPDKTWLERVRVALSKKS